MTSPASQPSHRPRRIAVLGLAVNTLLVIAKLLGGILGHSSALVADALESATDIVASLITLGGLHFAAKPPDETHPYGHGRAESIAAFVVAAMVFLAGIAIAVQAIHEIVTPHRAPAWWTLLVLGGVIITKEAVYRLMHRVARDTASTVVATDAWHNRTDAITSLAAAIGITIALLGGPGFETADDWAALVAAAIVLYNAWALLLAPLHELMDRAPDELIAEVRATAEGVEGVLGVEKTLARKHGAVYLVDMHVEVDAEMPVREAHRVAHAVKNAVRARHPGVADVLVHIEPWEGGK